MSDYSDIVADETYEECMELCCCTSMAENLYNGDIGTGFNRVAIPYRTNLVPISYCPWCGTRTTHMEENLDYIEDLYNTRERENREGDE